MKKTGFYCLLVSLAAILLCSCSTTFGPYEGAIKQAGADFYDKSLDEAVYFLCTAASVGSIRRNFLNDETRARAYIGLCRDEPHLDDLIVPAPAMEADPLE